MPAVQGCNPTYVTIAHKYPIVQPQCRKTHHELVCDDIDPEQRRDERQYDLRRGAQQSCGQVPFRSGHTGRASLYAYVGLHQALWRSWHRSELPDDPAEREERNKDYQLRWYPEEVPTAVDKVLQETANERRREGRVCGHD